MQCNFSTKLGRLLPVKHRGVAGTPVPATPTLDVRRRRLLCCLRLPASRPRLRGATPSCSAPGTGWCVARRFAGDVPSGELGFRFGEPLDVDGDGHADVAAGARFKLAAEDAAERQRHRLVGRDRRADPRRGTASGRTGSSATG